jgi:hypothetical protein
MKKKPAVNSNIVWKTGTFRSKFVSNIYTIISIIDIIYLENPLEREKRKMKTRRTVLIIGLVLSLLASMTTISFALPIMATQQQKVQLLDELRIFTGSNGDYRLNDQLSRSEASALAVRIMGKDYEVLLNASKYKNTPYPDVDPNHWYAPYVGFCTKEGILSGDTKGNYNPNDFITEKSFLKIVLGVLGYQLNSDYIWDNVYRKAFEVGLVTSLSYIAKEEDNTDFKRGDAVNVLYNALMLKEKSSDKELFYRLIDSNIITTAKAIELGLIEKTNDEEDDEDVKEDIEKDETPTDIEELIVFDENTISIVFNEDIDSIGAIRIFEVNNEDEELEFDIEELGEDYILLKTEKQSSGLEYIIEFEDIEDVHGNVIDILYEPFVGVSIDDTNSNFFRIQKVEAVNEKSIKVYFTHPLNINSENPLYYMILNNGKTFSSGEKDQLLVRTVNAEDHCVLLTIKNDTFEEGEKYTVEINGDMNSAYGVGLNDGKGDEISFTGISGEIEGFKLEDVIPYERETILLSFNKEVNPFLAQQIYNFYVTDKNFQPIAIEQVAIESQGTDAGKVVYIHIKDIMKKKEKYYVTINNLNDITRQEYITERTYSFVADYGSTDKLEIVDTDPIDIQTIDVYFNSMLDETSAANKDNYYINLRRNNTKIYPQNVLYDKAVHPYKVTLFFNEGDMVGKKDYEVKVSYELKDYLGKNAGITLTDRFKSSIKEKEGPSIQEVTPISSDAVKIVFNKEIAFNQTNLSPANFHLECNYMGMNITKVPLSVLYVNARTLILKFDKLEYDMPYTLKFNTLVDFTGAAYKVTGDGTNYVEFELEDK